MELMKTETIVAKFKYLKTLQTYGRRLVLKLMAFLKRIYLDQLSIFPVMVLFLQLALSLMMIMEKKVDMFVSLKMKVELGNN